MNVLIDTHILIWIVRNDERLSATQREVLENENNALIVSPIVAYELTQLQSTHRIPLREPIDRLQELVGFEMIDLPHDVWQVVPALPDIHRDPLDRLLVAHSLHSGFPLMTADANIRQYPVETI